MNKQNELEAAFINMRQPMLNYLFKKLPDSSISEDILQEVFVKALKSRTGETKITNLQAWLFTVLRTAVVDYYRQGGIETGPLEEDIPELEEDETLVHQEIAACLTPFLNDLPKHYRETLMETDINGKTMREVAEEQGLSVSAIKSRAVRGRKALKEKLLACCNFELASGLVKDFEPHLPSRCKGGCS